MRKNIKLRRSICERKTFAAVIALQCAVLLLFCVKCFGGAHTYAFDGVEDGITSTGPFSLSSGAYEVVVRYENRAGDGNASGSGPLSVNYAKILGSCRLQSQNHASSLTECWINLEDVQNERSAYVWVAPGAEVDDAEFVVEVSEGCDLKVTSVTMQEKRIYRVTRLLGWLILFVMADLLWLLLFEEAPFRLKKEQKYTAGILTAVCIAVNLPLATDFLYDGHDLLYHLARINSLAAELQKGQFPVRIETGMLNGYGYVSPVMYGSLFLYLPAVLQCMMVPLETAYRLFVMVVNSATCLLTYLAVKRMFGKRWLALTGAFVYTFSAYRLVDVYVRAAVGEYTAMMCFPLIVWGFYNILAGTQRNYVLRDYLPIILGLTGVIQSHIISCEMTGLFLAASCVLCVKRVCEKKRFFALVKAAVGTVLLNLWFLVPFLSYFREDLVLNGHGPQKIQNRGLYLSQIFDLWISATGYNVDGGMYNEMGLGIGIALTAGLFFTVWYRMRYGKFRTETEKQALFYILTGTAALFLTTTFFPWDHLQKISRLLEKALCVVQFPWRYLAIATILLLFLLLTVLSLTEQKKGVLCAKRISLAIVAAVCLPTTLFFREYTVQTPELNCYGTNEIGTFCIGVGEYLMEGEDIRLLAEERLWTDGVAEVSETERRGGERFYLCENPYDDMEGTVTIPVIHYPNYAAEDTATGKEIAVTTGENRQICLVIPAGYQGKIRVWYRVPVSWRIAEIISLFTSAGILILYLRDTKALRGRRGTAAGRQA